jgi:hypothetical protein
VANRSIRGRLLHGDRLLSPWPARCTYQARLSAATRL